jgi:subtilisin family serine protease
MRTVTAALLLVLSSLPVLAQASRPEIGHKDRVAGSIDPSGDTDEFPFSCAAGSTLTLKLENRDEEPKAPAELPLLEVTLFGPDDAPIALTPERVGAHKLKLKNVLLPLDGRYELVVGVQGAETANYELSKFKLSQPKKRKEAFVAVADTRIEVAHLLLAGATVSSLKITRPKDLVIDEASFRDPDGADLVSTWKVKSKSWKTGNIGISTTGIHRLMIDLGTPASGTLSVSIKIKSPSSLKRLLNEKFFVLPGSISGGLVIDGHLTPAPQTMLSAGRREAPSLPGIAAGELIVHVKSKRRLEDILDRLAGYGAVHRGSLTESGPHRIVLEKLDDVGPEGEVATRGVVKVIAATGLAEHVHVNTRFQGMSFKEIRPDDPLYSQQWHYEMISLPQAWRVTQGSSDVVVAVIDTGVHTNHPDLQGVLLPGYDFIASTSSSLDGDGWDDDPTDDDWTKSFSHGTHVVGAIGAKTNNMLGVAGISWNVKVLPIRVIGRWGADDFDLAASILWAIGESVPGVALNPNPAKVINLSLGGSAHIPETRATLAAATAKGVIVVAAAGNEATIMPSYPAAYDNVIAVAAVGPDARWASYSNFGDWIDIAAPGGDINRFGTVGGVYSTTGNANTWEVTYVHMQGTSMAAPHVSGLVALLLAADPDLTRQEVYDILTSTAWDLGSPGKDWDYGWGLINAGAAVREAASVPPPSDPILRLLPDQIQLDASTDTGEVWVVNLGAGTITVDAVAIEYVDGDGWLEVVSFDQSMPSLVQIEADRTGLADGIYEATLVISVGASTLRLPVFLVVSSPRDRGAITVILYDADHEEVDRTETSFASGYRYRFTDVMPGSYFVEALADHDGDGEARLPDEWFGAWRSLGQKELVQVTEDLDVLSVDIPVMLAADLMSDVTVGGGRAIGRVVAIVRSTDTGLPITGATVTLGTEGTVTEVTDTQGRAIFRDGTIRGPLTISAAKAGYETVTFADADGTLVNFRLTRLDMDAPRARVTVQVTGLGAYDAGGYVCLGDHLAVFAGSSPSVTIETPVSADPPYLTIIVQDIWGSSSKFGLHVFSNPLEEGDQTVSVSVEEWTWRTATGTLRLPQDGHLDLDTVQTYGGGFLTWAIGGREWIGIGSWGSSLSYHLETASFADDDTWPGGFILGARDAYGQWTEHHVGTAPSQFPASYSPEFPDVPDLAIPYEKEAIDAGQTFFRVTLDTQIDFAQARIVDQDDGSAWTIHFRAPNRCFMLPDLGVGGLRSGRNYTWTVIGDACPGFTLDNFNRATILLKRTHSVGSAIGSFTTR